MCAPRAWAPIVSFAFLLSCGSNTPSSDERGVGASGDEPSATTGGAPGGESVGGGGGGATSTDGAYAEPRSRHGYGGSRELCAFADAITDVALAAIAGGDTALPSATPISIESSGGAVERVRADAETAVAWQGGAPDVLGLYFEVELYLAPSGDADAGPSGGARRSDQLSLGIWIGSRGPRVTLLRFVAGGAGAVSLPPPPAAIRSAVEGILGRIREGGGAVDVAFGDADRAAVGESLLGAQMRGGAPSDAAIEPARRALAGSPRIRAWAFDDIGVLVRGGRQIVLLGMKITVDDTGLVLEAQPLVRAQRVGPAQGR